ncbi:MAG: hypothetical protein K0U63_08450 [Cyanobacteria bacterium]|nr:hypothetical protein [Cyanobacteriota bacterium]
MRTIRSFNRLVVRHLQRPSALAALVLALGAAGAWLPVRAAAPTPQQLQALEAAFNGEGDLLGLLAEGPGLDPGLVERRQRVLRAQFPDARWQLSPGPVLGDGRPTVNLLVRGSRQDGPLRFRLEAKQQLALESDGRRITGQTVLRDQSILRSGDGALPVTLLIPDAVLTGQRYDVDVLLDDPLDGAIAAGGIVELTPLQVAALESPDLKLGALGAGGVFRTVQAPFSPGTQAWAVLLVHPDGVVSVSKQVRVVADRAQLQP